MKKWIKILLWIVGVTLALLAVLSLLAGPIAKGYINKHGEDLVGRKVEVGHVGVNLLTGNVKVRDLAVYEDNAEDVFVGFDTLDVTARLLKIPFGTLHFSHITLAGLNANVIQDGQRFNFSSIIDHFAKDSAAVEDTTPSHWTMKFYNIRISHAELHYSDAVSHKEMNVVDVHLRVPGFVMGGDEDSEGGLNLAFTEGGRLGLDASYDTKNSAFDLKADLVGFAMKNIESYVSDMLRFESLEGTLDAHLTAAGRVNDVLNSKIAGTVAMRDMAIADDNSEVAGFRSLDVKVNYIRLGDNSFDIESVTLDGLRARYEQWEGYSNISRLTTTQEQEQSQAITLQTQIDTPAPKEQAKAGKPMQLRVGSFRMTDAAVTYVDHTMPDLFEFPVTNLSVSADNLTTKGQNNADVRASLPGGGHLMVRWDGNITNWKEHQSLFLTVKGLDMRQLSPLTVAYTGQPVEDGIFGLSTRTDITNSELDSKIKLDIYKAKVGSRRDDVDPEYKIPLKTALYILKDKNEKILIDMPVTGNIDSPEFNYMKLVWKTLGNLLVKVATSPARAIGNALGFSGDDNLEFIAIDTMQRGLTSEQYHLLSNLAAIAKADPLLTYTLEQRFPEPANDTLVRRYARFNESIRRYMTEQGVGEDRVKITIGVLEPSGKTGYAVSSELKLEE